MALPNLTRLGIGTHPPVGAPCARTDWPESVFERLPFELVKLIIYSKIDAPSQHPKDALEAYDQWCSATAPEKAKPAIFGVTSCIHEQSRDDHESGCRALLMHIFQQYGWKKWLHVVNIRSSPLSKVRTWLKIDERKRLDPALESLTALRDLADLHAACYVRDDESFTPFKGRPTVIAHRACKRGHFLADVKLLSFEYVTSRLVLRDLKQGCHTYEFWESFNGNLRRWNPRSLRGAAHLFSMCGEFEGKGVDKWTMTALENADLMFVECKKFNADLALWNPVSLRSAGGMFLFCRQFEGKGLDKWSEGWAKRLSEAREMFSGCNGLDVSNLKGWKLPNYELKAEMMFQNVPISEDQARKMACLMEINTRGTEQNMPNIDVERFEDDLWPIYNSGDDPDPVASADNLDPKNPWHVAGVIFGLNEHGKYRGPHVMALLASAVEEWRKKYPA